MKAKEDFMNKAIKIAKKSAEKGDYAVGAVIVKGNKIIATGMTEIKNKKDPTLHAEIIAIRKACKNLNSMYLEGCILYSTHEPCPMCAAAAIWGKMKGVVFGVFEKDAKNQSSKKFTWRQINVSCKKILEKGDPKLKLVEGFMRKDCLKLFDLLN